MAIYSNNDGTFSCDAVSYEEVVFANFAQAEISGGVTAQDKTLNVVDGVALPALGFGQVFYAVIEDAVHHREIVKVTARNGSALTVLRGQDGTTPRAFVPGDKLSVVLSAKALAGLRDQVVAIATAEACQVIKEAAETVRQEVETMAKTMLDKDFPVGSIFFWMTTKEYPQNAIVLNGSAYSRTVYKPLFELWGTMFGAGDGSTTFNVPKCNGLFLRFCDSGAGVDPDAATRSSRGDGVGGDVPGSIQQDATKTHNHGADMGWQGIAEGGAWAFGDREHGEGIDYDVIQVAGGKETRPKNIYMIPMVRAL